MFFFFPSSQPASSKEHMLCRDKLSLSSQGLIPSPNSNHLQTVFPVFPYNVCMWIFINIQYSNPRWKHWCIWIKLTGTGTEKVGRNYTSWRGLGVLWFDTRVWDKKETKALWLGVRKACGLILLQLLRQIRNLPCVTSMKSLHNSE